jgi:hypothetical protein
MSVVRWQIYDPITAVTDTFEFNPDSGGSPAYKKTETFANTCAPDGKTLIFEGQDEPQRLEWSGTILTEAHYNKYVEWWAKRRQLRVTDDLGRVYWVYINSFTPTRVRAATRPWKHTFDVSATILSWA